MIKLLGYSCFSIGLVGFIFFINYSGTQIPLQALWFVLSIFVITAGIYLILKYKLQEKQLQSTGSDRSLQISQLILTGDKVKVTLDNSEVRTRSYQKEFINTNFPTQIEMLDGLYDGNRNYKTQHIEQTYIVFYKQYGGKTYKFISQPTLEESYIVKRYIDNQGGIDLYVDKANPNNYYFDFRFG